MQLYDPNRITKPLKRTNPKKGFDEDPGWEEISWDEAIQLMDDVIHEAVKDNPHGLIAANAVANLGGSAIKSTALSIIYDTAVEPSNSDICGAGVHQVSDLFTGTGNAMPDYEHCNYLLQFGTQAGTATRHGFNMTAGLFAKRRAEACLVASIPMRKHFRRTEGGPVGSPAAGNRCGGRAFDRVRARARGKALRCRVPHPNRTCGPALVDVSTQRIIRDKASNKALYMDLSDNAAKPHAVTTKYGNPPPEGTFGVDGASCSTGFHFTRGIWPTRLNTGSRHDDPADPSTRASEGSAGPLPSARRSTSTASPCRTVPPAPIPSRASRATSTRS